MYTLEVLFVLAEKRIYYLLFINKSLSPIEVKLSPTPLPPGPPCGKYIAEKMILVKKAAERGRCEEGLTGNGDDKAR